MKAFTGKTISVISILVLNASLAFGMTNTTPQATPMLQGARGSQTSQVSQTPKSCTLNGAPFTSGSLVEQKTEDNQHKSMFLSTVWPTIKLKAGTQSQTTQNSTTAASGSNSIPGFNHGVVAYFKNMDGSPATIQEPNLTQTVNGRVVTVNSKVSGQEQNQIVVQLNADNSVKSIQLNQTVGSQIQHSMNCTF